MNPLSEGTKMCSNSISIHPNHPWDLLFIKSPVPQIPIFATKTKNYQTNPFSYLSSHMPSSYSAKPLDIYTVKAYYLAKAEIKCFPLITVLFVYACI
jgi:hypothetical protein